MKMRAVHLLLNERLPAHLQQSGTLDSKSIGRMLHQVALEQPDKYAEIVKHVGDVGRKSAYWSGESLGLEDLRDVIATPGLLKQMDAEVNASLKGVKDPAERKTIRENIWGRWASRLERETMTGAMAKGNAIGYSVASGARGKPLQARAMLSTPALFEDSQGNMVPIFARRSYAAGVSPAEWLAGTYGARKSVIATKSCLGRGTKVRMADGSTRNVEDVRSGEFVLGSDITGATFPTKVVRTYQQGVQDVREWKFKVSTSSNEIKLIATDNHVILATSRGPYNKYTSRCKRGDKTVSPASVYHARFMSKLGAPAKTFSAVMASAQKPFEGGRFEPLAFVLGLLAGDGCLSKRSQPRGVRLLFSCADDSLLAQLNERLNPVGLKCRSLCPGSNYNCEITRINYKASHNVSIVPGVQGFVKGARFVEKQTVLDSGMHGKYAHEKGLPLDFYGWNYESMCQYLAGLLTADGGVTIDKNGIMTLSLFLTAKKLAYQVADVFRWLFGTCIAAELVTVQDITLDKIKRPRNNALHGFKISADNQHRNLAPVIDRMLGKKGETIRHYLAGRRLTQDNPYAKARRVEFPVCTFKMECFDLEVEHHDHLFVLENGMVVSNSTAKGGYLAKMAGQVLANQVVTENDCGTENGIDMSLDEPDVRNRFLARGAGGLKPGELISRKGLALLKNRHKEAVIVRSPLTCESKNGICARCAGATPDGKPLKVGDHAGLTASTSIFEPVTQMALNTKHLSGASTQKKVYSGLDWLQRFVQVPDNFPDRAPVAEKSGSVTVREAPQGGHYVFVGDQEHYVPHHLDLKVKTGQVLEAGEPLSEGVVRPDDVVRLRGLGEGRRYYAERYAQMLNDSGTPAQPRSVELLARAAVNHVQVTNPTDDMDGILPDDIVPYNTAMRSFSVPEDAQEFEPLKAVGKYLQKPALHYTPGTLLTPKMAAHLQKNKISKVTVHDKGTSFTPSMVRLQAGSFAEPDWFASLNTSYLGRQLSQRAQRGQDTNVEHNIHFAPRLAAGVGFGDKRTTTGQY